MRTPLLATAIVLGLTSFSAAIPKGLERDAVSNRASTSTVVQEKRAEAAELRTKVPASLNLVPLRPV